MRWLATSQRSTRSLRWLLEQPQVNDPTAAGSGRFGGDGETVGEGDPERGARQRVGARGLGACTLSTSERPARGA